MECVRNQFIHMPLKKAPDEQGVDKYNEEQRGGEYNQTSRLDVGGPSQTRTDDQGIMSPLL